MSAHKVLFGEAAEVLSGLDAASVDCCITSPPYWGLRDYGVEGQLGLERTPEEYVARLVGIMREVRRVLKPAGTLWLNMGDSYAGGGRGGNPPESPHRKQATNAGSLVPPTPIAPGLKPKDLVGVPWRVAFALQADGWWLRNDIVWAKPNAMPESVTDRFSSKHEDVFLLSKAGRYWFDLDAVREEPTETTKRRVELADSRDLSGEDYKAGTGRVASRGTGADHLVAAPHPLGKNPGDVWRMTREEWHEWLDAHLAEDGDLWTLPTQATPFAHFATFPLALAERCLLAGCPPLVCSECGRAHEHRVERTDEPDASAKGSRFDQGKTAARDGGDRPQEGERNTLRDRGYHPACECNAGTVPGLVLDPFAGSGTVAQAARKHHRRSLGIELNPKYEQVMRQRLGCDGMFDDVEFEEVAL